MKLLDLFCCAGGAGEGYRRAGFEVTGVDIQPQPNNPHTFVQSDAIEYLEEYGYLFDAIHASPPCQGYSNLRAMHPGREYPMLIDAVRDKVRATGKPYIIENVEGAPLNKFSDLFGGHGVVLFYRDEASKAMGIDWMTRDEMCQAIPPAYTEWIGKFLMIEVLRNACPVNNFL